MTTEATTSPAVTYRALVEQVEQVARTIEIAEVAEDDAPTVQKLVASVTRALGHVLGLSGGRIYIRQSPHYRLWTTFGSARAAARGIRVPESYPPIGQVLRLGAVFMEAEHPDLDRDLEAQLGAGAFAVIEVGDGEYLVAFDVTDESTADQALFALSLLRNAINQRIRRERIEEVLREARRIQGSLFPAQSPPFGRFEIAGRSVPLETVGGDFFDYIPVSDKILGLAIADVSGHGLPAALQVRDVYIGLRMGMARDFKMVRTVERLNQIIHQSAVSPRFVSMFYGELETDGSFLYVNAGHPPPFHLAVDDTVRDLEEGGPLLGPLPRATYHRGYVRLVPGDVLVFHTDGITDAVRGGGRGFEGEPYGRERLVAATRRHRHLGAAELLRALFEDLEEFGGREANDDRTLVVVKLAEG
ncbi:MAG TPA: PP2C family protein-serine/threonine phosphatase [Thermoanaerobaculia bacterium]|nr:PP2C family protein-serine/threonine phosphatase [Thermoanaerobaculia bacterium]